MSNHSLEQQFVDELNDIYHTERRLTTVLPKVARSCASPELREAIEANRAEGEAQVARLERVFEMLQKNVGAPGEAPEGHIAEAQQVMGEDLEDEALKDAGIVAGFQKVEHYEIESYGTLRTWARLLGHEAIADALDVTLDQKKVASARLKRVARSLDIPASSGEAA